MSEQIEPELATRRLSKLQGRQNEILDEIVARQRLKEFEVLFEEQRENGVAGRSDNNFLVQIQGGAEFLGQMKRVKITNPRRMVLYGEVL